MKEQTRTAIRLLEALTERAKELTCLYAIEELLRDPDKGLDDICMGLIEAIPPGWQYPEVCTARITLDGREHQAAGFEESPWSLSADVLEQDNVVGTISVYYLEEKPSADHGPFLTEERKLIDTIAERLGHFLVYTRMRGALHDWQKAHNGLADSRKQDWEAVLDLLQQTDRSLYLRIASKMLNHLCWSGIKEAEELRIESSGAERRREGADDQNGVEALQSRHIDFTAETTERLFRLADQHLSGEEVFSRIQMWIQEDRLSDLVQAVHAHPPLSALAEALRRYCSAAPEEGGGGQEPSSRGLKAALIRRILSTQIGYVNLAKDFVEIGDLHSLLQKVIYSSESRGRLGGKSAGLVLAGEVLKKAGGASSVLSELRIPRTWYVSSDMMLQVLHYNRVDEIMEQKYKQIDRIRAEYPHIVQTLAHCAFPPEFIRGLSMALDDLGDGPLIVRSSSLLEDRAGAAFFGKYKTSFLANRGSKQERLDDLMHAVGEVYASVFAPEPIEYRADRGLLDFTEEMGIMIQRAVGTRVGPYFFPLYSGIALSRNDVRWSSDIRREDGVVRLVPGLGTRAVARTGDDHPTLLAPGQPGLRLNDSVEEIVRYAPRRLDAINLETKQVETLEIDELLREYRDSVSHLEQLVSVYEDDQLHPPERRELDFADDRFVVSFDGLISRTSFVVQIRALLKLMEDQLGIPVELEFASDGWDLFLLQCRRQAGAQHACPAPIPRHVPADQVIFSGHRNVANGRVANVTHLVYVDPARAAARQGERLEIVKALRRLNELLPKRQFAIIGPSCRCGRETRGAGIDYSDINKAAALVEIAEPGGLSGQQPSFGVHFFQDLIESRITYLHLDGDERNGVTLNERFLKGAPNLLAELVPECGSLADAVRVIDVPGVTDGLVMQILMNADLDEALGLLTKAEPELRDDEPQEPSEDAHPEGYWRWRLGMAEQMAATLDAERFGVEGLYVFGSTKNGTAGPGSDIDILIHSRGDDQQQRQLLLWLEGWSLCLDQMNYQQTGYRSNGLLDVHIVKDVDIERRSSFAVKIDAVTDAARPLQMKLSDASGVTA